MMKIARVFPLLCTFVSACSDYAPPDTIDGGPRWNLDTPFYIFLSPTMPKTDMVRASMRDAIGRAGGTVTVDERAGQVLNILDTDGDKCVEPGVQAFVPFSGSGKIYFCHSATLLASYSSSDVLKIATHELGHELANRPDHIGGEPPAGTCTSRAVMTSNIACRTADLNYTAEDREYICARHNVIGGFCKPRQLP